MMANRRDRPEPDAQRGRKEKGGKPEDRGNRQALREQFIDRTVAVFRGKTEVTLDQVAEIIRVLFPERAIELVSREELLFDDLGDIAFPREWTARGQADE